MKAKCLFLIVLIALSRSHIFAEALDDWRWVNPLPTGEVLSAVAFGETQYVAVGARGATLVSNDGYNWLSAPPLTDNNLAAVAYGNGLFVAVGERGSIETSTDGTNWTLRASGTGESLNGVAYGSNHFVAVGAGGVILSSTNGLSWSLRSSPVLDDLSGVAYGNNVFVATGTADHILLSPEGESWLDQTLDGGGPTFHDSVIFGNGLFVIRSHRFVPPFGSYSALVFTAPDGITWKTNEPAFEGNFITSGNGTFIKGVGSGLEFSSDAQVWNTNAAVSGYLSCNAGVYANGKFVFVGEYILTSTNGVAWTNQSHGSRDQLTSVASANGIDIAVGGAHVGPGTYPIPPIAILLSTNGGPYVSQYSPVTNQALSTVIHDGNGFLAVGTGGVILQTSDGLTWTQRNSGTVSFLHGLAAGGGIIVTVGDSGTIQTSPNGLAWTGRFSGTTYSLYGLTFGDGMFVAVGELGTVITSPDGISWTAQYSGQTADLFSVVHGPLGFVATGESGTLISSTDGMNWTEQNSGTSYRLRSVSYGNGYYVALGDSLYGDNVVVTSYDSANWTELRHFGNSLYGTGFVDNRFLLLGSAGRIFESGDTTIAALELRIHRSADSTQLTVFSPSGASFAIQGCSNLSAAEWTDLAAFTNATSILQWTDSTTNQESHFYRAICH